MSEFKQVKTMRKLYGWLAVLAFVGAAVNTVLHLLGWTQHPEHTPLSVGVALAISAGCGWMYFVLEPEKNNRR